MTTLSGQTAAFIRGGLYLPPRRIGIPWVKERLAYYGRVVDAREAINSGRAGRLTGSGGLMDAAHAFAGAIHREFPASNRDHEIGRQQKRREAI